MTDTKFKFDPKSLSFEEQDLKSKSRFIKMFIGLFMLGIIIAFILLMISSYVIVPPSTRKKIRENQKLKKELLILTKRFLQTEKVLDDIKKRDENIYKVIMESDPNEITQDDSINGIVGVLGKIQKLKEIEVANFINHELDSILNYMSKDEKLFINLAKVIEIKEKMLANIPSIQPVKNDNLDILIYGFGKRIDPVYKTPAFHNGIDYSIPEGTKVFATANGRVSYAGNKRGYGKMLKIEHGYGFASRYSHLSKILVPKGKKVNRGDVIALSGNSGKSMTPHLHYEVHVNNKEVNPVNFYFADLTANQYELMIRLSSRGGLSLD